MGGGGSDLTPTHSLWFKPTQLTAGNESNYSPILSHNGQSIFFTTTVKDNKDIWRQLVGGGGRQAVTKHAADDFNPSLSPDGKWLAFVSRRQDAAGDIHIVKAEDSWIDTQTDSARSTLRITADSTEDREPSWFPDSETLVFAARRPGALEPRLMVVDTTEDSRPVPLGEVYGSQPTVSPDGNLVAYVRGGDIYVYNIDRQSTTLATQSNGIQHGNPRFTADNAGLYFISYRDDTNGDLSFDASDTSTLWHISLADLKSPIKSYLATPLTTAEQTVYSPFVQAGRIFFSMQVGESLDIYHIPTTGQHQGYENLGDLVRALSDEESHERRIYLIRRSASLAARQDRLGDLFELQLLGIREEIANADRAEAVVALETARAFWSGPSPESRILHLLSFEVETLAVLFPNTPNELSASMHAELDTVKVELAELMETSDGLRSKPQLAPTTSAQPVSGGLETRFYLRSRLLGARLEASLGNLFEAAAILQDVRSLAGSYRAILAETDLYEARLSLLTSGHRVAIGKLIDTIKTHSSDHQVANEAAQLAANWTKEQDGVEGLTKLLTANQHIPTLAAIAHFELAKDYLKNGKNAVAANELRQIVDRYFEAPKLRIEASGRLTELEEVAGRHEQAGQMLRKLYRSIARSNSYAKANAKADAKNQYTSFRQRRAEYFMAEKKFNEAQVIYKELVAEFPDDLKAHRGLIDAGVANGQLEVLRASYEKAYAANSHRLTEIYTFGYVETFLIDAAADYQTRLAAIDKCIAILEEARRMDGRILVIHQSLGWLYLQKSLWQNRYEQDGAGLWSKRLRLVGGLFGGDEPDWLGLSVNALLTAYNLSSADSLERSKLDQNLAEAYYQLGNFPKSLRYSLRRLKRVARYPFRHKKIEALYWTKAGRAAFQTDELDLSASLLKRASSVWEQQGDLEQAAQAKDQLALTLTSLGRHEEAADTYRTLVEWHEERWQNFRQKEGSQALLDLERYGTNLITVTTNLGVALYHSGRFDEAVESLTKADQLLVNWAYPIELATDDDAIKISLGDGSAAKGFDRTRRQWLIRTFLALAYEGKGRTDLARTTLELEAQALLEARRQKGVSDQNENPLLVVELAHLHNKLGWLELRGGDTERAAGNFTKAAGWARLSPQDGVNGKLLNEVNFAKVVLRRVVLGLASKGEQNAALDALQNIIDQNKVNQDKTEQSKAERKSGKSRLSAGSESLISDDMIEVYLVAGQLLSATSSTDPKMKNASLDKVVEQSDVVTHTVASFEPLLRTAVASLEQVSEANLRSELLIAWLDITNKPFPTPVSANHRRSLRQQQLGKPDGGWRYLAGLRAWTASYQALQNYIGGGGFLSSEVDRLLARQVFEQATGTLALDKPSAYSEALRQYANLELLELFQRSTTALKVTDETKKLRTILEVLYQTSDAELADYLDYDERAIVVHQRDSKTFDAFCYKGKRELLATSSQGSLASLFGKLPRDCYPSAEHATLYLVPTGNLFRHRFELMVTDGKALGSRYPLAYLPSIDLLPAYRRYASIIAESSYLVTGGAEVGDILQNDEAAKSNSKLTADQQVESMANLTETKVRLAGYDIFHVKPELRLNGYVPSDSILNHPRKPKTSGDSWSIGSCFRWNLAGYQIATWPDMRQQDLAIGDAVNGDDGWKLMGLLGLQMEVPTQLVASEELDSPPWSSFYEQLATKPAALAWQSYNLKGRLIGYGGVHPNHRTEFAKKQFDSLYEVAEDAYEDEDWPVASAAYRHVYHLANLLEDDRVAAQALEAMVGINYLMRDYNESRRYKLKQVELMQKSIAAVGDASDYDQFDLGEAILDAAVLSVRGKTYGAAERLLAKAERIFKEEDEAALLGKVYHYRGINFQNRRSYKRAIAAYKKSRFYYQEEDPVEAAHRTLDIGNIYRNNLSKFEASLQYYRAAARTFAKYERTGEYIAATVDLANTLMTLGRMPAAISTLENEIIPQVDLEEEPDLWIRANQILGNAYFRIGSYQKARHLTSATLQAVHLVEPAIKRISRTLDAQNLEAMIDAKLGSYTKAFRKFNEAISTSEQYSLASQTALLNANLGFWHREAGLVEESLGFFNRALAIDRKLKSASAIAFDERNIGLSLILTEQFGRARQFLNRALANSQRLNLVYNQIYCLFGLGELALRTGDPQQSKSHFQSALELAETSSLSEFRWRALAAIGDAAAAGSEREVAIESWRLAIEAIETLPPGAPVSDSPTGLAAERGVASVYDQLTEMLMTSGQAEAAWLINQRSLARIHLDSYAGELPTSVGSARLGNETKQQLVSLVDGSSARRQRQLVRMEKPFYRDLSVVQPHLGSDTVLLNYAVLNQGVAVWLTTRARSIGYWQSISKTNFGELVEDYRTLIENYSSLDYLGDSLAKLLLGPVAKEIEQFPKVIINGSGLIDQVPFAALPYKDKALIDFFEVSYIDHSTDLIAVVGERSEVPNEQILQTRDWSKSKVLAIAVPKVDGKPNLPFTAKEVAAVKRFMPQTKILLGKDASLESIRQLAPNYGILHFATHGQRSQSMVGHPMELMLGGASSNQSRQSSGAEESNPSKLNRLGISEVFKWHIDADLVTLSACESAVDGSDDQGVRRTLSGAFRFAGAKDIIGTLWRISDVASAFAMKRFYRALYQADDPGAALREAQLVTRSYFKHPAYWASFRYYKGN